MLDKKIAFIGPGVMAEAMIAGLLRKKLAKPEDILASGPREERGADLSRKYKIKTSVDNASAASHADVVVLSVKPQRLSEVMKGLYKIRPEALVLSIVAGASIQKISKTLKHQAVVRFVEDESYLDMATALSGTGPAYVFLFTEALIDAGVHMGFPRRIAEQLVLQTIKGSVSYYHQAERHPATLRNQVTSPGGTSAEALYYLEKAGFRTAISRAVWAAYQRSLELGKEKPGHIPEGHMDEEEK
jgi:pyrroline-5-carboxylate reductase